MSDREKMMEIIKSKMWWDEDFFVPRTIGHVDARNLGDIADALIEAGFGEVCKWQDIGAKASAKAVIMCAKAEHRAEVAERALVIMAERVLEYAEKANVMATTSDGLFSCDKDAQLALLANDALCKAEQKIVEEEKEGRR